MSMRITDPRPTFETLRMAEQALADAALQLQASTHVRDGDGLREAAQQRARTALGDVSTVLARSFERPLDVQQLGELEVVTERVRAHSLVASAVRAALARQPATRSEAPGVGTSFQRASATLSDRLDYETGRAVVAAAAETLPRSIATIVADLGGGRSVSLVDNGLRSLMHPREIEAFVIHCVEHATTSLTALRAIFEHGLQYDWVINGTQEAWARAIDRYAP